jgi:hypothetical protein
MNAEERRRLITEQKQPAQRPPIRLWCRDEWKPFEVFRVPVDGLLLNVDNRRFAAERKLVEEKLGHDLDPENSTDDEISVISILLDTSHEVDGNVVKGTPSKDYEALKSDWLRRQQETPFWIRPDGTVRNGNRRLAMLKRLREGGVTGTEWIDAVILDPSVVDENDMFEMEQREQLTEDFKVRYTDINLLLALRDAATARGIDWADSGSIQQVASELQQVAGGDQAYAVIQLQAIRYMDDYLSDLNAPGQYQKLFRQVERFRDVGKIMAKMETDYPDEAPDMLRVVFAAIKAGNPHGDIRALGRMFRDDRPRYNRLLREIEQEEAEWEQATEPRLADPDLAVDVEEDEGAESEPPGPVVPNYPVERVQTRIKNAIDGLAASDLDITSMLEQALSRLETLTADRDRLVAALAGENGPAVQELLGRIVAWADQARAYLSQRS